MSVVRTAFLGTPFIASECLRALHEDEHFEIVGVVSQPDRAAGRKLKLRPSAVKQYALEQELPVLTPESAASDTFLEDLMSWGAECAVVVAYGQLLPQKFLDLFPQKIVNVHASLLPRWRGAAPIQRSIMAGEPETGVCLQAMVKKLDAGAVIGERRIQVPGDWSAVDLHDQLIPLAQDLLKVDLMDYLRGNLAAKPQDENLVTYAHKLEKSESLIRWENRASDIHNHVRGMQMGPGAYTVRDGKKLKVIKTELVEHRSSVPVGAVLTPAKDQILVSCGENTVLKLVEVQPESKPRMTAKDYLKGKPIQEGECFES